MNISEPAVTSRRSTWIRTLANTTALLIIAGSTGLLVADTMTKIRYDEKLFAVADNLFVIAAGLSCILAVAYTRADHSTHISWSMRRRVAVCLVCGIIAALVMLAVNSFYYDSIGIFQLGFSVALGLNIAMILFNVMTTSGTRNARPPDSTRHVPSHRIYNVYALLVVLIVVGIVLRILAPASGLLTWVVAPINLFITPGLSLALALLPSSVGWLGWLVYAPALSIGAQLLAIMWFNLLGIRMQTPAFFIIAAGITLAGFLGASYRLRTAS
jgi:hypothetical protein